MAEQASGVNWTQFWGTTYGKSHGAMQQRTAEHKALMSSMTASAPSEFSDEQTPSEKPAVVFVLGGPGCGKGTQCARIVDTYGWVHLSAGDLLRAEVASGSPDGEMISNYIKEGKIVPVEVTCNLLRKAMETSGKKNFLIDGFPRNQNNYDGWNRVMGEAANVAMVLFFDCSEEVMRKRLLGRAETSGRTDDNEATILKRFRVFQEESMPVIAQFEQEGLLRAVSAEQTPDEVFEVVRGVLSPLTGE